MVVGGNQAMRVLQAGYKVKVCDLKNYLNRKNRFEDTNIMVVIGRPKLSKIT